MAKKSGQQQIPVNVVGSSTYGRYSKISAARTMNMYISSAGEGDDRVEWLIPFPGYRAVIDILADGVGRGIFRSIRGDFLLTVINDEVYRVDPDFSTTLIGTLNTSEGEVYMDENLNNQICLVDGTDAYIYNHSLAPNLTVQALSGTLVPNYVEYHNTFFLFGNGNNTGNGAAWYAYSYATDTTISQTSQLALQTKPDYAIAVMRIPGQSANVMVFGTAVCEIHQQVGGLQNYRRVNSINIDYGCLSVATIDSADRYMAWLGVNEFNAPVIMVFTQQGAVNISSDGIAYELANIQFPQDSTAAFVRVDGHLMYQLTFFNPADNKTYLYDFNTEKFFNLSDEALNYHPCRQYAYFNQSTYFVSLNSGKLYELNSNINFINEDPSDSDPDLKYERQLIRITDNFAENDSDRFVTTRLVMTIEQGNDTEAPLLSLLPIVFGLENGSAAFVTEEDYPLGQVFFGLNGATGLPYRPKVDLSISTDGAITWSNTVSYPMNALGYRKNIMNWNQLGASNTMTFKFRFWGRSRFCVYNAFMEIRK